MRRKLKKKRLKVDCDGSDKTDNCGKELTLLLIVDG